MHPPRLEVVKPDRPRAAPATPAGEGRGALRRSFTGRASLVVAMLAAALALAAGGPARGQGGGAADPGADALAGGRPMICQDQTYALCAGASCFVFNDVAYCRCGVRRGDSISAPFNYAGGNICSVNAAGVGNGYVVSTFSLPPLLVAPPPSQALYQCPRDSRAAYAKCDGGICFRSTRGESFPGLGQLGRDEIVCSCPVERANERQGLEIIGPFPCEAAFFRNCDRAVANNETGATLYDGTAIGATETAVRLLTGRDQPLNTCP